MTEPLSAEGLARFSEIAAGWVASGEVPGVVALAARGGQVHAEVLGSLSVDGPPVREDSIFRIVSMTKPVTAAATLALAAEGLLRLDEPVDRLVPELAGRRVLRRMDGPLDDTVPARRAITVRDLLTFTFGFGAAGEMQLRPHRFPVVMAAEELQLAAFWLADLSGQPDPDTWIAGLSSLPLIAQPGERWLYNTGAQVLGVLLARAAGQPFAEVLRTRIFEPLGMRDTGFWASSGDRMATAYSRAGQAGLAVFADKDRDWSEPPAFCDGAAGLVSTAADLLAFSQMMLRGGSPVLPARAAAEMTRDQLTPEQKGRAGVGRSYFRRRSWGFCLSVVIGGPDEGAYGMTGGLGTSWLVDPALDLTVIVMTQRMFEGGRKPPPAHLELETAARSAAAMGA